MTRIARLLAIALLPLSELAAQSRLPTPQILVDVPTAPTPFERDGKLNLAYEVHLTNMAQSIMLLEKLEVLDQAGLVVATFDAPALAMMMARPIPALKLVDPKMIESGKRAIVFMWLELPAKTPPATLRHRLSFQSMGPRNFETNEMIAGDVKPRRQLAPIIGAPLSGGPWVARFGGNPDAHRRTVFSIDGRTLVPQRFAIDFGKLGPDWRQFKPNGTTNADVYGYADDILAVADARVAAVADSIAENDPLKPLPPVSSMAAAHGNHVILDLGNGYYASYSHMLPNSIRVKTGDRVKKGQVIGKVGNTGSSLSPHLHFQLMSDVNLRTGDGLPYMFDAFTILGIERTEQFEAREWHPDAARPPRSIRAEMTPNFAVVRFP